MQIVKGKLSIFVVGCFLLSAQILILYPYVRNQGWSMMSVICEQANSALFCFFPFWVYGVLTSFNLLVLVVSLAFHKRLLKAWWYVIFPFTCVVITAIVLTGLPQFIPENIVMGSSDDVYNKYRSNEEIHGLFEINEEAKEFVTRENSQNGTKFEVIGPNLKTLVPVCAAPLEAIWTSKDRGMSGKNVSVICTQTNNKNYPKWEVTVPVFVPK